MSKPTPNSHRIFNIAAQTALLNGIDCKKYAGVKRDLAIDSNIAALVVDLINVEIRKLNTAAQKQDVLIQQQTTAIQKHNAEIKTLSNLIRKQNNQIQKLRQAQPESFKFLDWVRSCFNR